MVFLKIHLVASVSLTFSCAFYTLATKTNVLCLEVKKEDGVYFSTAQVLHKFCVNYYVVNVVIGMITEKKYSYKTLVIMTCKNSLN